VAFGKLADFAATLSKGAHVAIEGELRSHEYQRELAVGTQKTNLTRVHRSLSTRSGTIKARGTYYSSVPRRPQ
jgi:single-stranded DNA-binding protein